MTIVPEQANEKEEALNGLPAKEREETTKILDEIASDEEKAKSKAEPTETPQPAKPEKEAAKPEEKKPEDKSKDGETKPEVKPRRAGRLIPAYVHYSAEDAWKREKAELEKKVIELSAPKDKPLPQPEEKKNTERDSKIASLAEKHGVTEEFLRDVVENFPADGKLPPELEQKINEAAQKATLLTQTKEAEIEEKEFDLDFASTIVPLMKAEYGDSVPQQVIDDVKEDLKKIAYGDKRYADIPYEEIYQGKKEFRNIVPPLKKGAEQSRGGTEGAADMDQAVDLTKEQPDEIIRSMTFEQLDAYSKNMEKKERKK